VDEYWLKKMGEVTGFYSKGRSDKTVFKGDSEDKDKRSTEEIQKFAREILSSSFTKLENAYVDAITRLGLNEDLPAVTVETVANTATMIRDWKVLKEVPKTPVSPKQLRNLLAVEPEPAPKPAARKFGGDAVTTPVQAQLPAPAVATATVQPSSNSATASAGSKISHGPAGGFQDKHSHFDFEVDFQPWIPFANTHNSRPYEVYLLLSHSLSPVQSIMTLLCLLIPET
jgi:hypothetical protein